MNKQDRGSVWTPCDTPTGSTPSAGESHGNWYHRTQLHWKYRSDDSCIRLSESYPAKASQYVASSVSHEVVDKLEKPMKLSVMHVGITLHLCILCEKYHKVS